MQRYWSSRIKSNNAYVPGEQPKYKKYIKLNTNENPYKPSPKVIDAIRNFDFEQLRLYPDPECQELKEAISSYYQVSAKEVFVGNGSDEILGFLFQAFTDEGQRVYFPQVTYGFYKVYAEFFKTNWTYVSMNKDLSINLEGFLNLDGVVLLANPNAPTGTILSRNEIKEILMTNKESLVIIDEAYIDFGGETSVPLIKDFNNLLVIKTFSKSRSLAGMRVGYSIGNDNLIQGLEKVKNSFNSYTLDKLAQVAARIAILDTEYFNWTTQKIINTRERVSGILADMDFEIIKSNANFIFIRHPNILGAELFRELRDKGILVRHFAGNGLEDYIRVTIGTDEDMNTLTCACEEILGNSHWRRGKIEKAN